MVDKRIGFIGIIIEDRTKVIREVNEIISQFSESIIARTGIPYKERDLSVITLVVDMTSDDLGSFTGKIGQLEGVMVKSGLSKK